MIHVFIERSLAFMQIVYVFGARDWKLTRLTSCSTFLSLLMPPKGSSSGANMPSEEDEPLQAVILADTYNERFKPLTINQPRVRLTLTLGSFERH